MASLNNDVQVDEDFFRRNALENATHQSIDASTPYTHANNLLHIATWPESNILTRLFLHPELTLLFAKFLRPHDLIALYTISRDFHNIIDARFTTVVLSQAFYRVPKSASIFHWRCYRQFCRLDPAGRISPNPVLAARSQVRLIPSFRWLKMLLHREKVCYEIVATMAELGVPVPMEETMSVLRKMWFLLDVPENARRIKMVHNTGLWTDVDLYFANMLYMRLDMAFSDPVDGPAVVCLRDLLLSQRGLVPLMRVLKREECRNGLEIFKMWLRYKGDRPEETVRALGMSSSVVQQTVFGMHQKLVGTLQYEGWGLMDVNPRQTIINMASVGMLPGFNQQIAMAMSAAATTAALNQSRGAANISQPGIIGDSASQFISTQSQQAQPSSNQHPSHQQQPAQQHAPRPPARPIVQNTTPLMRPDQLTIAETCRRKLDFTPFHKQMILWGYVDSKTARNLPPKHYPTSLPHLAEGEDDEWERVMNNGGEEDELLDRNDGWKGSIFAVRN